MRKLLLDEATGEYVEVWIIGRDPKATDKGYVKVFRAFLEDIIEDKELFGKAGRLLLYIVKRLDWNTLEFVLYPDEAMQELGISEATFYRWLKVLIERGYIKKLKTFRYRLKPYAVVRGSMAKVKDEELVGFG